MTVIPPNYFYTCTICGQVVYPSMGAHMCPGHRVPSTPVVTVPNTNFPKPSEPPVARGWVCPVCGRGVAPWMSQCPCQGPSRGVEPPIRPRPNPYPVREPSPPRTDIPLGPKAQDWVWRKEGGSTGTYGGSLQKMTDPYAPKDSDKDIPNEGSPHG